ncbi:MAG TPA: hypothetical protein VFI54_26745 [Solirubrobacteraceae bacterium]|nr:hypothetical protein [Solirubrobacteraceae bacterium]
MAHGERRYQYSVVRDVGGPGYADVALVRLPAPHGMFERLLHHERDDAVVLAHRTFRPMLDLTEMEAYAAQLERAAKHGNEGTLGCFVETEQRDDGVVRVALYERWFDGRHLWCEQLALRDFDAAEPDALVASTEFLTELQAWAADRNEQREDGYIEAVVDEQDRAERAAERDDAARQLAGILEAHNTAQDIE